MSVNYRNVEKFLVKWTKKVKPKIHRQVDAAVDGCKNRILDRLRAQISAPADQEDPSEDQFQAQIQQILNEASEEFQIQLADAVAVCFGDVQQLCQNELAKPVNKGLLEQAIAEAQIKDEPIEGDDLLDDNNGNDSISDVDYVCEVAVTYSTDNEATDNETEEDLTVVSKPSTSTRTRSSSKRAAANKENAAKKKGKEPKAKASASTKLRKEAKASKSSKVPKDGTSTKRKTQAIATTPKRKMSTKHPRRKSRAKRAISDDDDDQDISTSQTPRKRRRHLDALLEEDSANKYSIINLSLRCTQPKCDIVCENKELLLAHLKRTHQIEKHRCMLSGCTESFVNTVLLGEHLDTVHPIGGPWLCGICGASFTVSYTHLVSHHYKLHEPGHFKCSAADCTFESLTYRSEVQNHQKRAHRFGFTCGICEKGFPGNIDLQRHQLTHTNLRPFSCAQCDKAFNQDSGLQRHILTMHTDLKTVRCTWPDCTYTSVEKSKAVRHIRTKHFKLPKTMKEQQEANIIDERDPTVYVAMITQ